MRSLARSARFQGDGAVAGLNAETPAAVAKPGAQRLSVAVAVTRPFEVLDAELVAVVAICGFLPGELITIHGGSAVYFSDVQRWVAAPLALLIGGVGAVSVFYAVYIQKRELKCACVGGAGKVPLGFVSLTENLFMVAMALWMLAGPHG